MNDEVIGREILGEVIAPHKVKGKSLTDLLPQKVWDLDPPDILRRGGMGAGFGHQDFCILCQLRQGRCALPKDGDIALIPGKQDGEGRQQALLRLCGPDGGEGLGIRDDELRGFRQRLQGLFQTVRRAAHDGTFFVQQFPDGLDLGEDQPPLGGLNVLGHHQQDRVSGLGQVSGDGVGPEIIGDALDQCLPQLGDVLPGLGAHGQDRQPAQLDGKLRQHGGGILRRIVLVALVQHSQDRQFLLLKLPIPGQLLVGPPGQHENGDVRFFQGLFGLLDPQRPQLTRVVQSGRVDEHDGSHAAQLKGFVDWVRGRPGDGGDQGNVLSRQGVDERGFPSVSVAEEADVQAAGPRGILQSHNRFPRFFAKL